MFIWLRSTLPQFASYLSSFQTDPSYQKIYGNNSVSMQDAEMALTRPLNHYKEAGYYYAVLNGTKNKYKSLIRIDEVNGQGQLTSYTSKIGSASEAIGQYVLSPKYFSDNKSLIDTKTGQLIRVKTVPSEEILLYVSNQFSSRFFNFSDCSNQ